VQGVHLSAESTSAILSVLSAVFQINQTCRTTDDHWFCEKSIDVANFLNLNTYTDHDEYCLAYILTYRDFADGTLGLAWVAKPGCKC